MEPIFRKFCQRYDLPEETGARLFAQMERQSFRKGDCLVREGGRCTMFCIVARGIWLGHYLHDGVDVSLWFAGEGEALFSTWGYIEEKPSLITIEAMCDSEIYCIPKAEAEAFFASGVEAANLGRRIMERQFLALENWMLSSGSPRAEDRYRTLIIDTGESRTASRRAAQTHRLLPLDNPAIAQPHPCPAGPQEAVKRPLPHFSVIGVIGTGIRVNVFA